MHDNNNNAWVMKKALRKTQTLRAGCSKTEPNIFVPPQTPFPGAQDGQNLISWRWSLPLPIQTQFGEDRCTQFRVILVTDPQIKPHTNTPTNTPTHRNTQTGPITIHCAAKLSAQCKNTLTNSKHKTLLCLNRNAPNFVYSWSLDKHGPTLTHLPANRISKPLKWCAHYSTLPVPHFYSARFQIGVVSRHWVDRGVQLCPQVPPRSPAGHRYQQHDVCRDKISYTYL